MTKKSKISTSKKITINKDMTKKKKTPKTTLKNNSNTNLNSENNNIEEYPNDIQSLFERLGID